LGELHGILAGLGSAQSVLLVAGRSARGTGWAATAAIALADRAAAARSCVLLDLTFDGGELHAPLNTESLEGVADIFLYGASLKHVVQRPAGHRFEFAPAGLPADYEMVLTHRRWHRLLGEFQSSAILMLAYVPADAAGLPELARRIGRVIVLGDGHDVDAIAERLAADVECLAVLSPPESAAVAPNTTNLTELLPAPSAINGQPDVAPAERAQRAASPSSPERAHEANEPATHSEAASIHRRSPDQDFESIRLPRDAAREALIAEMRVRQRSARITPQPPPMPLEPPAAFGPAATAEGVPARMPLGPVQPSISEPSFVVVQPRPRPRRRRGLYIAIVLAVLAAAAAAAWIYYTRYLLPINAELPPAVVPPPPLSSRVVPLPYSVAVEAHQGLSLANERVKALRQEEPELAFYVAPVLLDSVLYYRVMAGPVADSAEASALLRRLLENGHKTGATPWDVRQSPLAFVLGEYVSRGEAEAREVELSALSIPTYVIEVSAVDGQRRFRVYAGAYAGFAEADLMRRMLRGEGLPDSLVQRVGVRR
jgi:hypothetical protein